MSASLLDVERYDAVVKPSPAVARVGKPVRDPLVLAVLVTILCFAPTGVIAAVHAARVKPLLAAGELAAARRAAARAALFCWISMGVSVMFLLVICIGAGG